MLYHTKNKMHIRFQFERDEELKFIGHLDILRLFERAFKRSGLPVTHSQGFNPRPQIVFAQPMPLGLTSSGEFADVEINGDFYPVDFMRRLNSSLPPGLQLIDAKERINKSNLMAIIEAARYKIAFSFEEQHIPNINVLVEKVLSKDAMNVIKKTKSGEKEINIRPLIYELSGSIYNNTGEFKVLLGAGQNNNVRPELFLDGVSSVAETNLKLRNMHRIMLYCRSTGENSLKALVNGEKASWVSPMDEA